MTVQESDIYNPDTLCDEFVQRHDILATRLVRRELLAIYWTIRTKLEIDSDLNSHAGELDRIDLLWGLLRSMLDRTFEYVEGAIVAYVTGSTASCEIISRTAIESAMNLLFILVDTRKGDRLTQYLAYYFDHEQKEIEQWLKSATSLASEAQKVHQMAATEKRARISKLREVADYCSTNLDFLQWQQDKAA